MKLWTRDSCEHNMPDILFPSSPPTKWSEPVLVHYNGITIWKWKESVETFVNITTVRKYLQFHATVHNLWPGISPHCCRFFFECRTLEYCWHRKLRLATLHRGFWEGWAGPRREEKSKMRGEGWRRAKDREHLPVQQSEWKQFIYLCLWIRALKAMPSLQLVVKLWMLTFG